MLDGTTDCVTSAQVVDDHLVLAFRGLDGHIVADFRFRLTKREALYLIRQSIAALDRAEDAARREREAEVLSLRRRQQQKRQELLDIAARLRALGDPAGVDAFVIPANIDLSLIEPHMADLYAIGAAS